MAQLYATYQDPSRSITTAQSPYGSTLLGAQEGLASRYAVASGIFAHGSASPNLIEITLIDGSKLIMSGSFNTSFTTTSPAEFIQRASGTIEQIVEIESSTPSAPRYTLSDISLQVSDYFSNATWSDVLDGRDHMVGGLGPDFLISYGAGSIIQGQGGDDWIASAFNLINTASFRGEHSEYVINKNITSYFEPIDTVVSFNVEDLVADRDGIDSLINIERLQFTDINIALDTDLWDNAGSAYRLYKAAFDREPDDAGLGYWIEQLDNGGSLQLAASGFLISDEFRSLYGANPSDTLFLTKLYNNVLDRDPDQGGLNYWIGQLNGGMSRESALINFSESNENVSNVAALIENGIQYQPWLS